MKLFAQKPCSFGGRSFFVGEEVPEELVLNPLIQEKMGVLATISDGAEIQDGLPVEKLQELVAEVADVKFEIIIHAKEGDLAIQVTNEELSVFTDILQIGVSKADEKQKISEKIRKVDSEDLLILLDALDSRRYVKDLAQARAEQISCTSGNQMDDSGGGE